VARNVKTPSSTCKAAPSPVSARGAWPWRRWPVER